MIAAAPERRAQRGIPGLRFLCDWYKIGTSGGTIRLWLPTSDSAAT